MVMGTLKREQIPKTLIGGSSDSNYYVTRGVLKLYTIVDQCKT